MICMDMDGSFKPKVHYIKCACSNHSFLLNLYAGKFIFKTYCVKQSFIFTGYWCIGLSKEYTAQDAITNIGLP